MARKSRRSRIPTDIITASVTQLNHEGRGIAHINGKTTFLFGGLTGETVQFRYTAIHRQYDEGIVTQVLTPSVDRVTPRCPHFGVCGGCSLQHINPDAQRTHKQQVLLEHFQHQAGIQPKCLLEPLYDYPWEYRRRARLSVRFVEKKNTVLVGFRERSSRYVAEIHQCDILQSSIGKKIKLLGELLMQCEKKSDIAQLEIAIGDNATAVVIRNLVALPEADQSRLIAFAQAENLQFYLQPKGPDSIYPLYPAHPDRLFYDIPHHAVRLFFQPTQFTQINAAVNLKMIDRAIDLLALKKTDRVLDLFCGIGNFTLPIAKYCDTVIGVEGAENAIAQAKKNALENKINNAAFYTHDLFADISQTAWCHSIFDKVLLDPPRVGAAALMPYFKQWKPQRIVYISCHPMTLARDTIDLIKLGYTLEKAGMMDMFPQTDHIEAIALFVRSDHDKPNVNTESQSLDKSP